MKKSLLLAASLLAVSAHASQNDAAAQSVYTAENHPLLVQSLTELSTVDSRGIETLVHVDPFLNVNDRWKKGAISLREMDKRGEIKRGVDIDELTFPKVTAPVAAQETKNGFPMLGAAPGEASGPRTHVMTPGAPMQLPRTLQEGQVYTASEYDKSRAPEPVTTGGAQGLDIGFPLGMPKAVSAPGQDLSRESSTQMTDEMVLFEVLEPSTWKPAWEAYIEPNKAALYLPGGIVVFLVAFFLGRAKRKPTKIRK